jgi:DNA-binding transcriptional regulator YhcF (GntR family)
MLIDFNNEKPIYIQIAEEIEDAIFTGAFLEETQIPSTTEISIKYKINPATVLKGMNLLVNNGIVYKKRGIGVFVSPGAMDKIKKNRQKQFSKNYIRSVIEEAIKLELSKDQLIKLIERGFDEYGEN